MNKALVSAIPVLLALNGYALGGDGTQNPGVPSTYIDSNGNFRLLGAGVPTIVSGACGTGTNGAIVAGSNNNSGQVTIGASATTNCTITFGSGGYVTAPRTCVIDAGNAAAIAATALAYMSAVGTGTFVITGSVLASTNWNYICL